MLWVVGRPGVRTNVHVIKAAPRCHSQPHHAQDQWLCVRQAPALVAPACRELLGGPCRGLYLGIDSMAYL